MMTSDLIILHGHVLLSSVTDVTDFFFILCIIRLKIKGKYGICRREKSE